MNRLFKIIVSAILLFALVVGNMYANSYSKVITSFLCGTGEDFSDAQVVLEASDDLCRKIGDESIVLLKNANNALPIKDLSRVNLFGWGATDEGFLLKGVGSGSSTISTVKQVTLLQAFREPDVDIEYNQDIIDFYNEFGDKNGSTLRKNSNLNASTGYRLDEPSVNELEPLLADAKEFSDVAIFVISRCGGENMGDCPADYLDITSEEQATLDLLKDNFGTVIVLLNTTNTMHAGFLADDGIDAALYVGITGQSASTAIPRILKGITNPSGKLADTMTYSNEYDPTYVNISKGSNQYVEDIYFGYKWYETADVEAFFDSVSNEYGAGYDGVVQYPFGYGLSYTDFSWEVNSLYYFDENSEKQSLDYESDIALDDFDADTKIYLEVVVTNEGSVPGKDVVELYFTPEYFRGEIEKAEINLLDFAKTSVALAPGESYKATLSFTPYDIASYDAYDRNNNGSAVYELDEGEYQIKLMTDSHNLKDCENNVITFVANEDIIIGKDPVTNTTIENRFTGDGAYMGLQLDAISLGGDRYMTRENFFDTFPTKKATRPSGNILNEANQAYNDAPFESMGSVVTGEKNGLYLATLNDDAKTPATRNQLMGKDLAEGQSLVWNYELMEELMDYNSEKWDLLLNQMSPNEMVNLVTLGGFHREAIVSIGTPHQNDYDGPAGFNTNSLTGQFGGETLDKETWTAYPSEALMGCSWNKDLMFELGRSMGAEADKTAIDGWYAPGVNLHRNAYLGRNYEYYSEDGVLSGKLAAKVIYGAKTNGLICYLKHFVSSDSGDNPRGTDTWMTEQNLRENVLKPFEIAVKEGGANGIMSAFNDLGSIWCGANYALLTEILRDEWGFRGVVITDWTDTSNRGSMSIRQGIRAGNDLWLNPSTTGINGNDRINTSNEIDMKAARRACKNILYSVVSTEYTAETYRNMDIDDIYQTSGEIGFKEDVFEWWKPALLAVDVLFVVCLAAWVFKKKRI